MKSIEHRRVAVAKAVKAEECGGSGAVCSAPTKIEWYL